jgi:hypothetical protein
MIPLDWIATPQEQAARFPVRNIWILRFAGYSRDYGRGRRRHLFRRRRIRSAMGEQLERQL